MKPSTLKITFLICVLVAANFAYQYFRVEKENNELRNLVSKSIQTVERENNRMFYDIQDLVVKSGFTKENANIESHRKRIEKLYKADVDLETQDLDSLTRNLTDKLVLNDSLEEFTKSFTNCCEKSTGITLEYFQHGELYHYGDTAFYLYSIYNSPYLMKNTHEIIGFTRNEFAKKIGNAVRFSLPTTKFMNSNEKQKDVDFDYKIFVKNIYTNEIDTVKGKAHFKIER